MVEFQLVGKKYPNIWLCDKNVIKSCVTFYKSLPEKCPNTEFFLVRSFPCSNWIRKFTELECRKVWTRKNSVFGHFLRSECDSYNEGRISKRVLQKTKHAKFSKKQTFLTPWYARVLRNVCFWKICRALFFL